MRNEAKSVGYQAKMEAVKKAKEERQGQIDLLLDIGQATSGQLAMGGRYILNKDLYNFVDRKEIADRKKMDDIISKKNVQHEKESNEFRKSYQKYAKNLPLSTTDIRSLIRKVKHRDDSPLKTKTAELKQQWERRRHRLNDYFLNPQNVEPAVAQTTGVTVEEMLIFDNSTAGNPLKNNLMSVDRSTSIDENQVLEL
jgi:hypothetical protein